MRNAESVTFGGGAIDRAHEARRDPAVLAALLAGPGARVAVLWRGKPLIRGDGPQASLAFVPPGHPALAAAREPPVFLARDDPARDDLARDDPARDDLARDDPARDDPARDDLARDDPACDDPARDDPARDDPARDDPARDDPARDGQGSLWAQDISAWEPQEGDLAAIGAFLDPTEQHHPALDPDQRFTELRAAMTALSVRDAELAATARALLGWHETHRFCARCGAPSAVAMGGWQRDCAACGAHHFPRTDPVVIMLILHGNDVLLGRSPGWPAGMYSLLAGFIEPGETVEAAVRREVWEEAGVRVGPVSYLASQPWPFPASLMLGCRGAALGRAITLDPAELEAALWVSRERLAGIFAGLDTEIRSPRHGAIAHFLLHKWLEDRLD